MTRPSVRPDVIVGILSQTFGCCTTEDASRQELIIASKLEELIQGLENSDWNVEEEEHLMQKNEDAVEDWIPHDGYTAHADDFFATTDCIAFDDKLVHVDIVKSAIAHYRNCANRSRPLSSMHNRFPWIKSRNHLNRIRLYEKTEAIMASRTNKLRALSHRLHEVIVEKMNEGISLRHSSVRSLAIHLNKEDEFNIPDFVASASWVSRFLSSRRLVSRKTTKFVTIKHAADKTALMQKINEFHSKFANISSAYPTSQIINYDQMGINREMISPRCLAPKGDKDVVRVVMSKSNLTHSYTCLPIISADGRLSSKLFVCLSEPNGMPQRGHFIAPNLYVAHGKSHIMCKSHFDEFLEACVIPFTGARTLIVSDSWGPFRDCTQIATHFKDSKTFDLLTIPPGATALCQPLDLFFNRQFKQFVRLVDDHSRVLGVDQNMGHRDNILKKLSAVFHQFGAPRFMAMIQYAFYCAKLIPNRPLPFLTPPVFCFNVDHDAVCACGMAPFLICARCDDHLCFDCFVVPHLCSFSPS